MLAKKLKSNRGVSILMGLVLFLVCCAVGAAALTSAASNVGRYSHLRQDQQRYLSVASAARLVRDELCKGTYEVTETTEVNIETSDEDEDEEEPPSVVTRNYTGTFGDWLDGSPASYADLGIELDGTDSKVAWTLEMEDDYTLSAHFCLEEGDATYYNTILTIAPKVEESFTMERDTSVAGQRWITTKTVKVTWPVENARIQQN